MLWMINQRVSINMPTTMTDWNLFVFLNKFRVIQLEKYKSQINFYLSLKFELSGLDW